MLYGTLVIFSFFLLGLSLFYFVINPITYRSIIRKVTENYILNLFEKKKYKLIKLEKLTDLMFGNFFKGKGYFEDEFVTLFSDTNYNRKVYCNILYEDQYGEIKKCTIKIWTNTFSSPYKVEYLPDITI